MFGKGIERKVRSFQQQWLHFKTCLLGSCPFLNRRKRWLTGRFAMSNPKTLQRKSRNLIEPRIFLLAKASRPSSCGDGISHSLRLSVTSEHSVKPRDISFARCLAIVLGYNRCRGSCVGERFGSSVRESCGGRGYLRSLSTDKFVRFAADVDRLPPTGQ